MVKYLSTDPNAGREPAKKYLSMDPMAGTDEATISAANSKYTVNPDPNAWERRGGAFVDRGVDMLKGMGSLGMDAAKSALTLEGQATFLPRMAKNMYEGMVESGAEAINRQTSPERKGLAAVPVVGPYVMNAVSDYEEGKGPEAEGRMLADIASFAIPGSKAGRAGVGAAARGAATAAKTGAKLTGQAALKVGPELVGAATGAALSGGFGGVVGGVLAHQAKSAVVDWVKNRYKLGVKQAEEMVSKMKPNQIADIAERESLLETKQLSSVEDKVFRREVSDAKKQAAFDARQAKIRPIPTRKLIQEPKPVEPVVDHRGSAAQRAIDEAALPMPDKPPKVTIPGETAPRIVSESAPAASRPSQVPGVARDVDSALRSLPKATQARLQHVVKQAMKEPTARLPQPDPSAVIAGRDPFKLGNRVYSSETATPRTRISEHYAINPDIALAEGATGVHPTLGLPMRADGKVLVRNVDEFNENPGRAPRGAPVWRDPDARFGNNQTVNEVAEMLEARSSTSTSIADLQKQLEAATKREPAPGSYAADEAARAARQKQHIADSYAAKEAKDAANVKQGESLIPDLEQSAELLKKYPKRGGESNVQWMKRVTESVKQAPSTAQAVADDLAAKVLDLSTKQGMSKGQIKAILEQNHGIPAKYAGQIVNMLIGSKK